uniref:CRISPR system Cms protein Csm5 n=1 Tax=Dictyoglomus thermophilum TaxID=14 RepID=A0A7C3RMK0_DICTH
MKVKIKTITPTLIRSGEELSNVTDCVIQENELKIIDKEKLLNIFKGKDPKSFVVELSNTIINEKRTIYDFLNNKKINIDQVTKYTLKVKSKIDPFERRSIYMPITTGNKAYIPGSTLKGIIRSALLFYYFENLSKEQKQLDITQKEIDKVLSEKPGDTSTDIMKYIIVRDTNGIPFTELELYKIERIPHKGISQYILAIPGSRYFHTEVIFNFYNTKIHNYWKKFFQEKEDNLWKALRNYSTKLVKKEIEILEKLITSEKNNANNAFNDLKKHYEKVLKETEENKNRVYLPIGFGKTYYFNSLGYFLPESVLKDKVITKRNILPKFFPSTRWALKLGEKYYPLGWCVLVRDE